MSRIVNMRGSAAAVLYRAGLWHLKRYSTGKAFPLAATFQLTNRCNLRCVMCNIPNNPRQAAFDLGLFRRTVAGLGSMGCCYASLSGGEILTISNFPEYLAEAKRRIPSVNAVTNGVLLGRESAREIARSRIDSVSISLDGMERTHEQARGLKGSFGKAIEAIEHLKAQAPGLRIVVNTVIAPWNVEELMELAGFVGRLGVLQKFQPLNEHPSFEGQARPYSVSKRIDYRRLEEVVAWLMRQKHVANSRYFLSHVPSYFRGISSGALFRDECALPGFFCEFREDGRMYPCLGGTLWKGGYPAERGVKEIFESPEYQEEVKALRGCRGCQRSYSVCYIEPRLSFPLSSFLRYRALKGQVQAEGGP